MHKDLSDSLNKRTEDATLRPFILCGMSGTGKTQVLRQFGIQNFNTVLYLDIKNRVRLRQLFETHEHPDMLLSALAAECRKKIEAGKTLIVFDGLHHSPYAIKAMGILALHNKDVATAGSTVLINDALATSPLIKNNLVDLIRCHPLRFTDFLHANGRGQLAKALPDAVLKPDAATHKQLLTMLRFFLFTGGMPEAVETFVRTGDLTAVRKVHHRIIKSLNEDIALFLKPLQQEKAAQVLQSLPQMLGAPVKKFVCSRAGSARHLRAYHKVLDVLGGLGAVTPVHRVKSLSLPLMACEQKDVFRLFAADVGLLGAMLGTQPADVNENNKLFDSFNRALPLQFVFQELAAAQKFKICYHSALRTHTETDFLLQHKTFLSALEVQGTENRKSKILKNFASVYPDARCVRLSLSPAGTGDGFVKAPLYAVGLLY